MNRARRRKHFSTYTCEVNWQGLQNLPPVNLVCGLPMEADELNLWMLTKEFAKVASVVSNK